MITAQKSSSASSAATNTGRLIHFSATVDPLLGVWENFSVTTPLQSLHTLHNGSLIREIPTGQLESRLSCNPACSILNTGAVSAHRWIAVTSSLAVKAGVLKMLALYTACAALVVTVLAALSVSHRITSLAMFLLGNWQLHWF